jgi:precorrin-6B methylase 2
VNKFYIKQSVLLALAGFLTQIHALDTKEYIKNVFENRSGFGISAQEDKSIRDSGGAPTYGEITYEGAQKLIEKFKLTKKDVFYDLGCGVGKFVIQVYLDAPVKKAAGIELSTTRIDKAKQALEQIKKDKLLQKGRRLEFKEQNILDAHLKDATAIFISSLCFSDKLLEKVTNKLARLKPGLRVATSRKLVENPTFKLIETLQIPMSWSSSSTIYFYELVKTSKK